MVNKRSVETKAYKNTCDF